MKTKMRALTAIIGIVILVVLGFQNCAKVAVSTVEDAPSQALNIPSNFSSAVVGTSELADLKMLFVVDNSYTMKQNNINLAQSFPTLFNSQNSDNLARFSVTSGLITVAQRTPAASLSDQTRINQLAGWQVAPSVTDGTQLNGLRQGASLGKLAGDSIGYSVKAQNGSFTMEPALVLGVKADGQIAGEISKGKSESPSSMVTEFKNRLSLLQNVPVDNYQVNSDILDKESGLCALARVLRSPSSFLKAGDLPVFGVFTDEDDSDVEGKTCVAAYTYSEEAENRIDGVCETRKTTVNYQIGTPKPASCQISYQDTFKWSLAYTTQTPSSSLSYYKVDHYSCPQTVMNYQAATAIQRKKTAVDVTYKTFKVLDGVKVYDASAKIRNLSYNGVKTSIECQTAAKAALNTSSEEYVSNTCVSSQVDDATCTVADSTCVVTDKGPKSATVTGDFTQTCTTKIAQTDSKYITGTGTCSLANAAVDSTTSVGSSCTTVMNPTAVQVTAIAKDLSTQSACETQAKTYAGAVVNSTYPATCSTTFNPTNATPKTGNLSLVKFPSVTAPGGACPADVKAQAITDSGVTSASVTGCTISSFNTYTDTQTLASADCTTQANTFCSSQTKGINCKLAGSTAASTTPTNQALAADEEMTCAMKCSDSKTGFCKPTASLTTVDPNSTIAQYLIDGYKALQGSCSTAAPVASSQVSTYNARLESQKATLCSEKNANGLPIYNRVTKAAYHLKGFAPDYVAGNTTAADGNSVQPKMDLPTYILQRSQELFGQQLPIINVFVRTANDPTGDAGSRGLAYERLATMMNGKVQSVLSPDYSSALQDLASIINSKITRSFKVPNMSSTQQVISVSIKAKTTGVTRNLASTEWSQSGQTVQVTPSVTLNIGDELQFEFK